MNLKVNPRKFSDKIALIKRKEALSNASFRSAIHGINEITVVNGPDGDVNILEIKDNCSNNSYSPDSFTSESTAVSLKNHFPLPNDGVDVKLEMEYTTRDGELFNNSHDLYQSQSSRNDAIFRPICDKQTKTVRLSNIDGYYYQNKNVTNISEPIQSGSLPNVSTWNNVQEYVNNGPDEVGKNRKREEPLWHGSNSNFGNGKVLSNNKSFLAEYYKTHGHQNAPDPYPYVMPSVNDPGPRLPFYHASGSSFTRTRRHGMDHGESITPGNMMESNPQTSYLSRDQYLSLPNRQNVNDVNEEYRHSYNGDTNNSSKKYMRLNTNVGNDTSFGDYGLDSKALTPTGYQSNTWTDNRGYDVNNGFLQPPNLSNVLVNENWRRVASDSSIQNSLKLQGDPGPQHHNINKSSFERVNSLKREHANNPYQRNQPIIQYPKRIAQNNYNDMNQFSDFSTNVSKVPNLSPLSQNIMDAQNSNSILKSFKRPNESLQQMFLFPSDVPCIQDDLPLPITNNSYTPMDINDIYSNSYAKDIEVINSMNCDNNFGDQTENFDNNNNTNTDTHECYWGQTNDVDMAYTNEPSPKTKPCENLDPKKVLVDIKADFSGIPEITLNDTEQQRRDSLNWTVEVLKNLNSDAGTDNREAYQQRDRSLSGYQPMVALTEEEKFSTDVAD